MQEIIKNYKINNADVPLTPVMELAVKYMDSSNGSVRKEAKNLILQIYKIVGDKKVKNYLGPIDENHRDNLQKEFDKINGVPPRDKKKYLTSPKEKKNLNSDYEIYHDELKKKKYKVLFNIIDI